MRHLNLILALLFSICMITVNGYKTKPIDIEQVYKIVTKEHLRNKIFNFHNSFRRSSCDIECENKAGLQQMSGHVPTINGCGSYNISLDFNSWNMKEFTECCNVHDGCYEDCYKTQNICDTGFESCLTGHCIQWAQELKWNFAQKIACTGTAKIMYLAVKNLGCSAYKTSREGACKCV